jgi:hypothetical protein
VSSKAAAFAVGARLSPSHLRTTACSQERGNRFLQRRFGPPEGEIDDPSAVNSATSQQRIG